MGAIPLLTAQDEVEVARRIEDGGADSEIAKAALDMLEVDDEGLDKMDRHIILTIMIICIATACLEESRASFVGSSSKGFSVHTGRTVAGRTLPVLGKPELDKGSKASRERPL